MIRGLEHFSCEGRLRGEGEGPRETSLWPSSAWGELINRRETTLIYPKHGYMSKWRPTGPGKTMRRISESDSLLSPSRWAKAKMDTNSILGHLDLT